MIERAEHRRQTNGQATIFFLDEIHRFNKAQQDALLPAVEEGLLTLIGATTENPYFEVNSALLSRAQIYELRPLTAEQVAELLRRALQDPERGIADPPERARRRDRVPRRALRRRRARRIQRSRARLRNRAAPRRRGHDRARRGRDADEGDPLRQGRRQALRLHLGLDQGDARLRRRRVALLPGRDAGGRRGPAFHRAADDRPGLRGHRQRRSAGAVRSRSRRPRRSSTWGCPNARSTSARPPSTWRWRRSPTPATRRSRGRAPTCASRAPPILPRTFRTPTTPAPASWAAASATSIRMRFRRGSPTSRSCPRASRTAATTSRRSAGSRRPCRERLERLRQKRKGT